MAKQGAIPKTKKTENSTVNFEEDDDDERYYGSRKEGKRHGQGTYFFTNGDYYSGDWRKGRMEGQGKYVYAGGKKYIGWFYRNEYVGEQQNGKLRRKASKKKLFSTLTTNPALPPKSKDDLEKSSPRANRVKQKVQDIYDHERYIGDCNENGERHGQGAYYYNNGNHYIGNWRKGRKEGVGTFGFANGKKWIGWFYHNEYVGEEPNEKLRTKVKKGLIAGYDVGQLQKCDGSSDSDSEDDHEHEQNTESEEPDQEKTARKE